MEFLEAKEIMKQKMGDWKIMALASCEDNYPMVRTVSYTHLTLPTTSNV